MMHGHEKSDSAIVATKPPNKAGATGGGGGGAKGGDQGEHGPAKRAPDTVPGRRAKCAGPCTSACAKGQDQARGSTICFSPSHRRTTSAMAFLALKRQASAGVDDVTWDQYGGSHWSVNIRGLCTDAFTAEPTEPKADP